MFAFCCPDIYVSQLTFLRRATYSFSVVYIARYFTEIITGQVNQAGRVLNCHATCWMDAMEHHHLTAAVLTGILQRIHKSADAGSAELPDDI